jgi:uncharacterized protein
MEWGDFDWDDGNSDKNLSHGVTDEEIEEVFLNADEPARIRYLGTQRGEPRYRALGRTDAGRYVFIAFSLRHRGTQRLIRPISARPMTDAERSQYRHKGR